MSRLKPYKSRLLYFLTNNTILLYFFFFFLIIDSYFLVPAVIAQIFIVTAKLVITIAIPTKEAKTETETHPVTVEAKISKSSI